MREVSRFKKYICESQAREWWAKDTHSIQTACNCSLASSSKWAGSRQVCLSCLLFQGERFWKNAMSLLCITQACVNEGMGRGCSRSKWSDQSQAVCILLTGSAKRQDDEGWRCTNAHDPHEKMERKCSHDMQTRKREDSDSGKKRTFGRRQKQLHTPTRQRFMMAIKIWTVRSYLKQQRQIRTAINQQFLCSDLVNARSTFPLLVKTRMFNWSDLKC